MNSVSEVTTKSIRAVARLAAPTRWPCSVATERLSILQ